MKHIAFIDEVFIKVKAGRGGDGKMGFHKEKYIEHGGPSGGNGGNGGSIFLLATNNENTLLNYRGKSIYKGNNGNNGGLKNMTGANGFDIYLNVPLGTEVYENNIKVADLQYDGQIWLASKGGRGGRGNKSFKSSKNTTPTLFEYGEDPEWRELKLSLKVLADVGLLGYPNAGKSTLINSITNAKSKVADYSFTTLTPKLGVVERYEKTFVITDLPGLIDGAANGRGMGINFLKHLSRVRVIVHLIDSSIDDLLKKYEKLRNELTFFSKELKNKKEIIVFSKIDLIDDEKRDEIKKIFEDKKIYFISSLRKEGLNELLDNVYDELDSIYKNEMKNDEDLIKNNEEFVEITLEDKEDELVIERQDNVWIISNNFTKFWGNRIPLTSRENTWRIISKLKSKGIMDKLIKAGIKKDDILAIKGTPFAIKYDLND